MLEEIEKKKKNHLIKMLTHIYKDYLNKSIKNFEYFIEKHKYFELNKFKQKKIFPRTQLIRINTDCALLKINQNVCYDINIYIEEVNNILKLITLRPGNGTKNIVNNLEEFEKYKMIILEMFPEETIKISPFIKIKIKDFEYYSYNEQIELFIKNLNMFELENLNIFLFSCNEIFIDDFFFNFSYFLPKNINKNEGNYNILSLLALNCEKI